MDTKLKRLLTQNKPAPDCSVRAHARHLAGLCQRHGLAVSDRTVEGLLLGKYQRNSALLCSALSHCLSAKNG